MRVLILEPASPFGQQITSLALEESHEVTAFLQSPAALPFEHPKLRVAAGSIEKIGEIDPAMAFQQAVICFLGTLLSEGTCDLIRAMRRHNARRLICVAGPDADAGQEELVRKCDRDWVIVRTAALTGAPPRGRYDVLLRGSGAGATSISSADAAEFVVARLVNDKYLYKSAILTD